MKRRSIAAACMILLVASVPAWAYPSRGFLLRTNVILGGAAVPAGVYQLSWETHGTGVSVKLSKGGVFVATARGRWVKHEIKYTTDEALMRLDPDGSRTLIEIRIAGTNRSIVFANPIRPVGGRAFE